MSRFPSLFKGVCVCMFFYLLIYFRNNIIQDMSHNLFSSKFCFENLKKINIFFILYLAVKSMHIQNK